jgi:hypothetical protein
MLEALFRIQSRISCRRTGTHLEVNWDIWSGQAGASWSEKYSIAPIIHYCKLKSKRTSKLLARRSESKFKEVHSTDYLYLGRWNCYSPNWKTLNRYLSAAFVQMTKSCRTNLTVQLCCVNFAIWVSLKRPQFDKPDIPSAMTTKLLFELTMDWSRIWVFHFLT